MPLGIFGVFLKVNSCDAHYAVCFPPISRKFNTQPIKRAGRKSVRFFCIKHRKPIALMIISRSGKHRFAGRKAAARKEESSKTHKESGNSPCEIPSYIIGLEAQPQY